MCSPKLLIRALVISSAILLCSATSPAQTIWYVDDDGDPAGGCTAWADACPELQTALSLAGAGDQIWVAIGVYRPDYDFLTGLHNHDRGASFQLSSGVGIYGGFDGSENALDDRAGIFDQTILSGDVREDDGIGIVNYTDNSYHVVSSIGTDNTAILDGFKVVAGNANTGTLTSGYRGGGLYNEGNPQIRNCIFDLNIGTIGGGMYSTVGSPTLSNCSFVDNITFSGFGFFSQGGGVASREGGITLDGCLFDDNTAVWGGGMFLRDGVADLTNCTFTENTSTFGGGLSNFANNISAADCMFWNNAADEGGGIHNIGNVRARTMTLIGCTFTDNFGSDGGGVYTRPALEGVDTLIDCKFIDNSSVGQGGGINKFGPTATTLIGCTFSGNYVSVGGGGGMWNSGDSNPTLINCLFTGNIAQYGGGMGSNGNASALVINSTFSDNTAFVVGGGSWNCNASNPTILNSILWGNQDESGSGESAQLKIDNETNTPSTYVCTVHTEATVNYSCIEGWTGALGGIGNIGNDPMFVDPDGDDDIVGTEDDDLRLLPGSPVIDAGINIALAHDNEDLNGDSDIDELLPIDLDGNPRFVDIAGVVDSGIGAPRVVDMGAYEHNEDCNGNGIADATDIAQGTAQDCNANGILDECEPSPDCNDNGVCDDQDVAMGTSQDCNANGVPDECEADCNNNGLHDSCDIANQTSDDCNQDGIPDECLDRQPDCNDNDLVDACETADGVSPDENGNGVPDECEPPVLFVDKAAAGMNNGTSWGNAFKDLRDAFDVARASSGAVAEIWVVAGTYSPGESTGNRNASFNLASGVAVYGGFAGGETQRDQRDSFANVTILSGDLAGNDQGDFDDISRMENSYNIVRSVDTDENTVLDGFTIMGGNATALSTVDRDRGAGMWNNGPILMKDLILRHNWTIGEGGGLYSTDHPTLVNCLFLENGAGRLAGGMFNDGVQSGSKWPSGAAPFLVRCRFVRNRARSAGGMLNEHGADPILANCQFIGNFSIGGGGGVANSNNNDPLFVNCLFNGNSSFFGAGGLHDFNSDSKTFNCTFTSNTSETDLWAGGMVVGATSSGSTIIANSVFWNNSKPLGIEESSQIVIAGLGGTVSIDYSCIQGLTGALGGIGNIGDDPAFVDIDGSDDVPGNEDDDLRLTDLSSCIDAGDNANVPYDTVDVDDDGIILERTPLDLSDNARFVDDPGTTDTGEANPPDYPDVVDMGAYEFPVCFYGDVDGSGEADLDDLLCMMEGLSGTLECQGVVLSDLDVHPCGAGNGDLDLHDLVALLDTLGGSPPCPDGCL